MTRNADYNACKLLIPNEMAILTKTKILVYREDYGGEIGSKRWLKQFIGKTPNDELRYQQNIVAIYRATISVSSMTSAVNDLLRKSENRRRCSKECKQAVRIKFSHCTLAIILS